MFRDICAPKAHYTIHKLLTNDVDNLYFVDSNIGNHVGEVEVYSGSIYAVCSPADQYDPFLFLSWYCSHIVEHKIHIKLGWFEHDVLHQRHFEAVDEVLQRSMANE